MRQAHILQFGQFRFSSQSRSGERNAVSRHAPYTVNVDRRNRNWSETVIALADITTAGEARFSLQPALLDPNGNPQLLAGDEGRAVIERLDEMSPNAEIRFCDGLGRLQLS